MSEGSFLNTEPDSEPLPRTPGWRQRPNTDPVYPMNRPDILRLDLQ
jgi:hypothetical protein